MKFAPYPSYSPVDGSDPRKMAFNTTLDFSVDSAWTVPLNGSDQGTAVFAISMFVDNTGNSAQVSYQVGSFTGVIPQYASGYIDINGAGAITFTCSNTAKMNVSALNYYVPAGMNNPTFKPVSSASTDPAGFSNVYGLWHFSGLDKSTGAVDSSNTFGNIIASGNTTYISTSLYYGTLGSSFRANNLVAAAAVNSVTSKTLSNNYTVECFGCLSLNAGYTGFYGFVSADNNGVNYGSSLGIYSSDSVNYYWACYAGGTAHATNIAVDNKWHHFALTYISTSCIFFLDGVGVLQFNGSSTRSNTYASIGWQYSSMSGTQSFNINEYRITNVARYATNFTVPSIPFPNS